MEVKPGYKQTDAGFIPEGWEVKPLGEVVEFLDGRRRPVKDSDRAKMRGDIPYYGASGVVDYVKAYLFDDDLILLGEDGENILSRNCRLAFKVSGKTWVNNHAHVLKPKSSMMLDYLAEFLESLNYTQYNTGTAQPKLNKAVCSGILVLRPPLPEQRAIANVLSNADAQMDALDRLITKTRGLKQAAMQQLLTAQTRLPGFQDEWQVKRLEHVGHCLRGVSYRGDRDLSTHDTVHTKRLLRSNNVQGDVVVISEVQYVNAVRVSSGQVLKKNDILICMANGSKALVGKAGLFTVDDGYDYTFGAFMGCFRTYPAGPSPAFIFSLFQTAQYRNYINNFLAGSSINNLRPSSIDSLEFSFPSVPEQVAIAEVLTDIDAEIAALEQRRDKTRMLKQAMMQALLTGKTRLV